MFPGTDLDAPATPTPPARTMIPPGGPPAASGRVEPGPLPDDGSAALPHRGLAARLLQSQLARVARAGGLLERRLGDALALMASRRLYRRLGYVRLGDYLTERLGMSLRRCQALVRLSRALRDLPLIARALESGDLPLSRAQAIAAAATPETQQFWLARAQGMSVREIETLRRAAAGSGHAAPSAASGGQSARPMDAPTDPGDSPSGPGNPSSLHGDAPAPPTVSCAGAADPSSYGGDAAPPSAAPGTADPSAEDEPGVFISFPAPGRTVALWHWALELARRVAGHQEPAWRCVEYLAAEFLSGFPDSAADPEAPERARGAATGSPTSSAPSDIAQRSGVAGSGVMEASPPVFPGPSQPALEARGRPWALRRPAGGACASGPAVWAQAVAAVREALKALGPAADLDAIMAGRLPGKVPGAGQGNDGAGHGHDGAGQEADATAHGALGIGHGAGVVGHGAGAIGQGVGAVGHGVGAVGHGDNGGTHRADGLDADPWAVDECLRALVRLRQSLAWRLGRMLRPFCAGSLHQELGFTSLEDWCIEDLGISPRRVRYLASLDRRLESLPLLADAYRRGPISWCQVRHLVRVVRPGTQTRWIRYARQVTVRRLEEAVTECSVAVALEGPEAGHGGMSHAGADGSARVAHDPLPPREPSPNDPGPISGDPRHTSAPPLPTIPPGRAADPGSEAGDAACDPGDLGSDAPRAAATAPRRGAAFSAIASHRIAFWSPLDVAGLWSAALRACRRAAARQLEDWECLEILIEIARRTWEETGDPGWRRRYRIFERDGWRCRVPGCTSRCNLNEHHIVFRSQGGGDEDDNLVTLCVGHHQHGIHEGRVRCRGSAPGALWWELGVRPDGPPLARYYCDRIVGSQVALHAVGSARSSGQ